MFFPIVTFFILPQLLNDGVFHAFDCIVTSSPIIIFSSLGQLLNDVNGIVIPFSIITFVIFVLLNAEPPNVVPSLIVISSDKFVQFQNAAVSIVLVFSGSLAVFKFVQLANAYIFMLVTVLGILALVILLQL